MTTLHATAFLVQTIDDTCQAQVTQDEHMHKAGRPQVNKDTHNTHTHHSGDAHETFTTRSLSRRVASVIIMATAGGDTHLLGSVARAKRMGTALKGGITPPRKTASVTSSARRRTWTWNALLFALQKHIWTQVGS